MTLLYWDVRKAFKITIKDLRLSNGAGFVVAYAGDIMIMPGLPKSTGSK